MMASGRRDKPVALQRATRAVTSAGYTDTWVTYATPYVSVEPASPSAVEHFVGATITTPISHLVTMLYQSGVRAEDRVLFQERALYIAGIQNPHEANKELILACQERTA